MLLAPGDDLVLDRPFLEIVEDMVARDVAWTGDMKRLIEIWNVEVADAPCEDLARSDELLEARERLSQRYAAAPVQQVAVETVRRQS